VEVNYFFAYPSRPVQVGDAIVAASARSRSAFLRVTPWQELEVAGNFIRNQVLNAIEGCDLLIADVTVANFNVTYEIGYAIGFGKPVLLVRHSALDEGSPKLQEVGLFDTIGYQVYENSEALRRVLVSTQIPKPLRPEPPLNLGAPIYSIEPAYKSDFILRIRSRVDRAKITSRRYDPQENPRLSAWEAIDQVAQSYGVLVPLLSRVMADHGVHNLRAAFIAGLGSGMKKPVVMLQDAAERPVPLDYRDVVKPCPSLDDLKRAIAGFVASVMESIQATKPKSNAISKNLLNSISLGANAAENEVSALPDYYLPIEAFNKARRGEVHVVVGRKGSGKSALFFELIADIKRSPRALVIDLRPETVQLIKLKNKVLSLLSEGSREHAVMAFWEYLLLIEIARHLLEVDATAHLRDQRLFEKYNALCDACGGAKIDFAGTFADRISALVRQIADRYAQSKKDKEAESTFETNLTAWIYRDAIGVLSQSIFSYLTEKRELWLLFDNIDKGWSTGGLDGLDLTLVRCLIDACRKLQQRLSKQDVAVHSVLFLRNDVYELLVRSTADRGKEAAVKVDWTDPDLLRDLLRLRFLASGKFGPDESFDDIWAQIAETHYRGEETAQYIIDRCLMRPRFLINLLSYCKSSASNLGHDRIQATDIEKGLKNYSMDLVSDLQFEMHDIDPSTEDLIYSFIGVSSGLLDDELRAILSEAGVSIEKHERVIEMLMWYGFLGLEQDPDETTFIYNVNYEMKLLTGLRRRMGPGVRYSINPAFEPSLGLRATGESNSLFG
jgi:hypothetical protein